MSLEEQIMADLKTAMLAKNETAVRTLRAIKSAIIIEKTSGAGTELTKDTELKMLLSNCIFFGAIINCGSNCILCAY